MNKNIRQCERIARVVVGLAIASLAFWGPQSMWFLLGLIITASGVVGFCPLYAKLGGTCCTPTSCCCKNKDKAE